MKKVKITALLLALLLLFAGCAHRFSRDEDGYGYTSERTGVHYTVLDSCYEAAGVGEEFGEYTDEKYEYTTRFYEIPELDSAHFLTDESRQVYCADAQLPNAAEWTVSAVLICDEDAISVELERLSDADEITAITALWFEGEESELPMGQHTLFRRIKLASEDYPNIYYCFSFYVYEDGSYLYDINTRRAVACTEEVSALLGED